MRTIILALLLAVTAAAPIGCAFGTRAELGRGNDGSGAYAPQSGPFASR